MKCPLQISVPRLFSSTWFHSSKRADSWRQFFFPNDDPLSTSKMNYRLACLRITPYPPAPSTILTLYPLKIISISLMERFFLASRNRLAGCDRLWGSITLPAYLFSLNTTIRHVRLELLRTKVRMFYATATNLDSVALMNRS